MSDVVADPVRALESVIRRMPEALSQEQIDSLTAHHFCGGLYARELFIPAGMTVVGKQHAQQNFFLLIQGELILATPDGPKTVHAPFMAVTQPGDKRAVYAVTDCICLNIHPNADDEQDIAVLESRYITPVALPAPEAKELLE